MIRKMELWLLILPLVLGMLSFCLGGCSKKATTVSDGKRTVADSKAATDENADTTKPSAELSFTADFVDVKGPAKSFGKSYVKGNKSRMEVTDGDRKSITIVRGDKNLVWMIDPEKKMYMEVKGFDQQAVLSPEAEKKLEELGSRKLIGKETVNGYQCDKYEFVFHDKNMGKQTHWISKKLGVLIKMEDHNPAYPMSMELRNISEKKVPDSMFELPSGYTKVEIPQIPNR